MVITRCQVMVTVPTLKPLPPNRNGSDRPTVWSQIVLTSPMKPNSSPTVTISCTTSGLPCRWDMTARSRAMPNSGATTSTVNGMAIHVGQPQPTVSCHVRYAAIIPMAPWAKLNTPVVEYTTTSPVADMA